MSDGNMLFIRTDYWSKNNKFLTASANNSIDLKGFDGLKTLCDSRHQMEQSTILQPPAQLCSPSAQGRLGLML